MCLRAASGMFATSVVRTRDKNPENTTREHFEMCIETEQRKRDSLEGDEKPGHCNESQNLWQLLPREKVWNEPFKSDIFHSIFLCPLEILILYFCISSLLCQVQASGCKLTRWVLLKLRFQSSFIFVEFSNVQPPNLLPFPFRFKLGLVAWDFH